jgi:heme O synthase-like polyprenyltransferase
MVIREVGHTSLLPKGAVELETKERIIWAVFAIFSIPALIISNLTGGFTFVITTVVVVLAVLVAIKGITEIHQNHTSKGLVYIFLALITVALSLFLR